MILGAGFGTRLKPLSLILPKPLFPVINAPLLLYPLYTLLKIDPELVVINLHHKVEAFKDCLQQWKELFFSHPLLSYPKVKESFFSESIFFLYEPTIRGTGGGIYNARKLFSKDTVIVINGDTIYDIDLRKVFDFHKKARAKATLVLKSSLKSEKKGEVEVDEDGFILNIAGVGKTSINSKTKKYLFTGCYILEPEIYEILPSHGCIVRDFLQPYLKEGGQILAYIDDGEGVWEDLGTIYNYWKTNMELLRGKLKWDGKYIKADHIEGKGVKIDGNVMLKDTILGDNVTLSGEIKVEESIIWNNTKVTSTFCKKIVTGKLSVLVKEPSL